MSKDFARNLSKLRMAAGITQKQLAEVLGVGATTISMYETGHSFPHVEGLTLLCNYFKVTTTELLGESAEEVNPKATYNPSKAKLLKVALLKYIESETPQLDKALQYQLTENIYKDVVSSIDLVKLGMSVNCRENRHGENREE